MWTTKVVASIRINFPPSQTSRHVHRFSRTNNHAARRMLQRMDRDAPPTDNMSHENVFTCCRLWVRKARIPSLSYNTLESVTNFQSSLKFFNLLIRWIIRNLQQISMLSNDLSHSRSRFFTFTLLSNDYNRINVWLFFKRPVLSYKNTSVLLSTFNTKKQIQNVHMFWYLW